MINPDLTICRELLKGVCGKKCSLEKIEEAERQIYMTAEEVKQLLPIIEAFANKKPVFVRNVMSEEWEWTKINPNTTEFRFEHLVDHLMDWRVEENLDD